MRVSVLECASPSAFAARQSAASARRRLALAHGLPVCVHLEFIRHGNALLLENELRNPCLIGCCGVPPIPKRRRAAALQDAGASDGGPNMREAFLVHRRFRQRGTPTNRRDFICVHRCPLAALALAQRIYG